MAKNYGSFESGGLDFAVIALVHRKRLSRWLIATNICCIAFLALLLLLTGGKKSPVILQHLRIGSLKHKGELKIQLFLTDAGRN
jgi:hypothetical protein